MMLTFQNLNLVTYRVWDLILMLIVVCEFVLACAAEVLHKSHESSSSLFKAELSSNIVEPLY